MTRYHVKVRPIPGAEPIALFVAVDRVGDLEPPPGTTEVTATEASRVQFAAGTVALIDDHDRDGRPGPTGGWWRGATAHEALEVLRAEVRADRTAELRRGGLLT